MLHFRLKIRKVA